MAAQFSEVGTIGIDLAFAAKSPAPAALFLRGLGKRKLNRHHFGAAFDAEGCLVARGQPAHVFEVIVRILDRFVVDRGEQVTDPQAGL